MLRKGFEGYRRTRGQQFVMTAVFMMTLASAALAPIASAAKNSTIFVSNVDELYAAVNNQANEGATVVLAPGRYCLSARAGGDPCLSARPTAPCVWESDASGAPRPNGGRLDLQKDMSLSGMAGDPAAVIIDGSLLPASSFTVPFGRTGIIRTGLGRNAIEWLTVAGSQPAAAAIATDLVEADEGSGVPMMTTMRVAHVLAGGSVAAAGSERLLDISCASTRGVDIRNIGVSMAGRRIDAEIVDSEVFGGTEGFRVANFNRADHGDITVMMRGNRWHTNRLGCIVENNRTNYASISIRSSGDLFEHNGLGCQIGGALISGPDVANSNSTTFDARGSAFINNTLTDFSNLNPTGPMFEDLGGLLVVGGDLLTQAASSEISGNTVEVRLWGSKIAGNETFDFDAYGARPTSLAATDTRVQDNHVLVELHGVSKFIEVTAFDTGTNTVTIVRKP